MQRHAEETERILRALAKGCELHPAYRSQSEPEHVCDHCTTLYELRQDLDDLDEDNRRRDREAYIEAVNAEATMNGLVPKPIKPRPGTITGVKWGK